MLTQQLQEPITKSAQSNKQIVQKENIYMQHEYARYPTAQYLKDKHNFITTLSTKKIWYLILKELC